MENNLDAYKEWVISAWEDLSVAEVDFQAGKYRHSIINCHHALEKVVKALYIRKNNKLPKKTHNIVEILRETYGELIINQIVSEEKQDFFADVSSFYPGINYPDSRMYNLLDKK